jgi:hypothetical protein
MSKNIWRRWWVKLWIKDVFKEGGILDKMNKEAVCTFFLLFAWSGDTRIMKTPGTINFDGIGLSEEQYCHKLRMTPEKFREMTKILCENEMITYEKGIITIVNFKYWQDKKTGEDEDELKNESKNESKNEVKKLRSKEVKNLRSKEKTIVPDGTPKFNALGYFIDEYFKNLKTKYIPAIPDKDGRLLKLIITNHGIDNYKLALSRYWSKKDNFITSRKYDVTAFNSVVGILLTGSVVSKNGQKTADEVMREMRLK